MEKNWKLHHIAIVVRDVDKAVEFYQSSGIGTVGHQVKTEDAGIKVEPGYVKPTRTFFVHIGPAPLELIQPVKEGPFKEFLDSNGEGLHHIAFTVDDLDKEIAKLAERGMPIIGKIGKAPAAFGSKAALFDTSKIANFRLQLIQG